MGNAPCAPCPNAATGSVVNLSEKLVTKLTEGITEKEAYQPQDYDIFEKLRCIDDTHSQAYGLNFRTFNMLIHKLEMRLKEIHHKKYCESDSIIHCLKTYPECTLNCAPEVDKFVDCVDTHRLNLIRKKHFESKNK